jgi:hypothetical protein
MERLVKECEFQLCLETISRLLQWKVAMEMSNVVKVEDYFFVLDEWHSCRSSVYFYIRERRFGAYC